MPSYDYLCPCGREQEIFFRIADKPDTVPCKCGGEAAKQLSIGGVQGDELPAWARHPEALGCLQPKGERPIETRSQMKKYLKDHNIAEFSAKREV
jgi:putative FmdB family regulatory protein